MLFLVKDEVSRSLSLSPSTSPLLLFLLFWSLGGFIYFIVSLGLDLALLLVSRARTHTHACTCALGKINVSKLFFIYITLFYVCLSLSQVFSSLISSFTVLLRSSSCMDKCIYLLIKSVGASQMLLFSPIWNRGGVFCLLDFFPLLLKGYVNAWTLQIQYIK